MDLEYVDILTRVASQAYMNLIYCSVCSSSRKGGDVMIIVWMGCFVILDSCKYHFTRVHANLVHHPSNDISIEKKH